jgi:hypothetical protein
MFIGFLEKNMTMQHSEHRMQTIEHRMQTIEHRMQTIEHNTIELPLNCNRIATELQLNCH